MAKSLSTILSQIERLQKEAESIQSEVISRIRKEIAKFGLTPEQLFGTLPRTTGKTVTRAAKSAAKAVKYANGAGNTWGGMGKRPDWLRQALEAGKKLEDFLVGGTASAPAASRKRAAKTTSTAIEPTVAIKKRVAKKAPVARRARAKRATAKVDAS